MFDWITIQLVECYLSPHNPYPKFLTYDVNIVVFKIVKQKGLDINHNNPTKMAKIMVCLRIKNK